MPTADAATAGTIIAVVMALTLWFFEYRRDQREAAQQAKQEHDAKEPKADPPLHEQFVKREEHKQLAARVDGLDEKLDTKFSELNQQRSTSIAGLHKRIEGETDSLRKEIKDDVRGLHERINEVLRVVSKVEGKLE